MTRPKTLKRGSDTYFWGVDLAIDSINLGWCNQPGNRREVARTRWDKKLRGGERLDAAEKSVYELARQTARAYSAVFAYVEQPSGSFGGLELKYMAGVIELAIWRALRDHWDRPVEVRMVTSGSWKREVVAADGFAKNGQFGKPGKDSMHEYPALLWAQAHGLGDGDDNDADAMCITELARRRVAFA